MSISINRSQNIKQNINSVQNQPSMSAEMRNVSALKQPDAPKNVKRGVLLTTALGIATGVAIAYNRGKLLQGATKKNLMTIDYDWKNVLTMASCSISGGLIGGAIFDKKENMKAKLREALIQMLGNIIVPIICVGGGTHLYDKYLKDAVIKKLNLKGKTTGIPHVIVTALCLATAIYAGFKTGNFINEDVYNIKDDRKFKFADMSGHLDDTCMALSLADPNNIISKTASRIIPLALMVCGYSTGIMQEWPDDIKSLRHIDHSQKHNKHKTEK